MILYPTAIGSEPILPKDSKDHWQNVMKGHAAANVMPVLAANRIGEEKAGHYSMTFFGSSFISDEYGNKVAEADRISETILYADFDLEAINRERVEWGVFRDRRIDLYGDILKYSATKK